MCVDNARRQQINEYVNRALAGEHATKLESADGTILLYEGANLIGSKTVYGITNAIGIRSPKWRIICIFILKGTKQFSSRMNKRPSA